ncbi:MAG: hypothetical protein JNG83_09100 [Opitutaceae bacterium]|nr:hypothetical protein [Opitutaceae bacterium]
MRHLTLLAGFLFWGSVLLGARFEPPVVDSRAVRSESYRVEVQGAPVFVTKFRDISYTSFSFDGEVTVTVHAAEPVKEFNLSPHSARIAATVRGSAVTFRVDRPRHLVLTVNGGEKLFLFAESIEPDAPRPGAPGVTNVLDYGVDPTGGRLDTARLQRAIDEVAARKGTLYVPPGVYLTGALVLKSNLTLYLAGGSRLLFSDNPDDYPQEPGTDEKLIVYDSDLWFRLNRTDASYRRSLLIDEARHVRVAGRGILDGRGKILRPLRAISFVFVRKSADVVFEGITLLDSPQYNAHVLVSERVTFRNVKIISDQSVHNTDGIDPDSSKDVLIDRCFLFTADDGVSPKATRQTGLGGDLERLTVRNCVFLSQTSATKFGNETFGGVQRDILFENNDILEADRAITISTLDGYGYENVRFIDTRIERLLPLKRTFPLQIQVRRRNPAGQAGWVHNVLFRNLTIEQEYPRPSQIAGLDENHEVRGVRFENLVIAGKVRLSAAEANIVIGPHARDITFSK